MAEATRGRRRLPSCWVIAAIALAIPVGVLAQGGGGQGGRGAGARGPGAGAPRGAAPVAPGAPGAPGAGPAAAAPGGQRGGLQGGGGGGGGRAGAPVDLTGYWVSIVTEDWIERMAPDSPPSGVIQAGRGGGGGGGAGGRGGAPGGAAGGRGATAGGEQCRAYGAAGSLRVPGRLNITWADDNTLKMEMDSGTQTRLLRFGGTPPPASEKSLQGYSVATWEGGGGGGRGGGGGAGGGGARGGGQGGPGGGGAARWGSLKVVTTNLSGGYLLSSRSAYSENAVLTEHFTKHSDFGVDYFTVTALVEDGARTTTTSSTFKKEANGSKFSPSGCEVVR